MRNVYVNNHYYYASTWVYSLGEYKARIQFYFAPKDDTDCFGYDRYISTQNKWEKHTYVKKITADRTNDTDFNGQQIKFRVDYDNNYNSGTVYIDDVLLIDLNETLPEILGEEEANKKLTFNNEWTLTDLRNWCDENLYF